MQRVNDNKKVVKKSLIIAMWLCGYVAMWLVGFVFAQDNPDLTIISPQNEETIFGNQVILSFFTSNFLIPSDGYLRLTLDENEPVVIKGQKDFTLSGLPQGKHTLVAELINKKHQPLPSAVKKEITFTSVLPKEEKKGINLEITPVEEEKTEILTPLSLGLLVFGGLSLLLLAFKFYINSKTSKNSTNQKPLG